jgi:hypothetical protein
MTIQVRVGRSSKIKVKTQIAVPENLSGVDNVDIDNIQDGYVLMYNDELQRYGFVDPDVLLSKAVEDDFLPEDFLAKLDIDLDDRINLDAGEF